MFAATSAHVRGGPKDSIRNAIDTGEFVINMATLALREQMNATAVAAPSDVDEFAHAGLTKAPSRLVTPPRVAESPVHLECRTTQSLELPSTAPPSPNTAVFGQVVGVHIDDTCIRDSHLELTRLHPIGRLGYQDYVDIDNSFSMPRPTWTK